MESNDTSSPDGKPRSEVKILLMSPPVRGEGVSEAAHAWDGPCILLHNTYIWGETLFF